MTWLKCMLHKGMFSDEIVVTYPPTGDKQQSFFVETKNTQGEPGNIGKVKVLTANLKEGFAALVPAIPYKETVFVDQSDVEY